MFISVPVCACQLCKAAADVSAGSNLVKCLHSMLFHKV